MSGSRNNMEVGLLSSASALAIVGYTGMVIYHGNLMALLAQLKADSDFLAWMVSAGVLYWLSSNESIGGPVRLIVGVAVLAVLLKLFNSGGLNNTFSQFAAGNFTLGEAFITAANQAGIALGLNKTQGNALPNAAGSPQFP